MTIYRVPMFGKDGLLNDLPLSDLPAASITSARNVRCRDGLVEMVYGHVELSNGSAVGDFAPYFTLYNGDALDGYWILAGLAGCRCTQSGISAWADITRAAGAYTGAATDKWVGSVLNGVMVLTNGKDLPQVWTSPSSAVPLINLPNWDANHRCKSIRAFKNYLVAMNITKSSTRLPHMVKWSHPADPGTYPSSWDETDATKDAGEVDLPGSDHLVDGGPMQDFFVLYKERSTHIMQFVGGRYIFRFSPAFTESGILAPNCWTELNGQHVVLTASDLIMHNGVEAQSLLNGRMRRWLFSNVDAANIKNSFLVKQWFFNELWLCYPTAGDTLCTSALVWNWKSNTVSIRDLPSIAHANTGPTSDGVSSTWDSDDSTWDGDFLAWNANEFTPGLQRVGMVAPTTSQFLLADSTSRFAGEIIPTEVVREGLTFDAPDKRKLVRSVRPRMAGQGNTVNIQLAGQNDLYGDAIWGPVQSFEIGTDFKTDHLAEGRYITLKITSDAADFWRLESLDFDIEILGDY